LERDARCLAALGEIAAHYRGRGRIIAGDALEVDLAALVGGARPARICANLPYNIATALLTRWLESEPWPSWFDRLTLMFQREVAERIVATPLQRAAYGRLAVLSNWRCETRILFDISPSAFTPPPKVSRAWSSSRPARAARLRGETPVGGHAGSLWQRRKMLRQSLKSLAGSDAAELLVRSGIAPTARAKKSIFQASSL